MKKLVFEGAEARTYLIEFNGKKAIEKFRAEKKYRRKELDEKIRTERTRDEVSLLHKAKLAGIRCPIIYSVNKKNSVIVMEYIKAKKLKEQINSMKAKNFRQIGKEIGLLHNARIVHGDLTTNNILLEKEKLCFLDFGLGFNSNKVEDFAVDLLGFKRTFLSSHPEKAKEWNAIKKGYVFWSKGKEVLKRIEEVEKRGRYL